MPDSISYCTRLLQIKQSIVPDRSFNNCVTCVEAVACSGSAFQLMNMIVIFEVEIQKSIMVSETKESFDVNYAQ